MPKLSRIVNQNDEYTTQDTKPYQVLLLLDTSGSMSQNLAGGGRRIDSLNKACSKMYEAFKSARAKFMAEEEREVDIKLTVITFGGRTATIQCVNKPIDEANWSDLGTGGLTPMGDALKEAKKILESADTNPSRAWRPLCVMVSDGEPQGEPDGYWEDALNDFIHNGRSSKVNRVAMALDKFDTSMLGMFVDGTGNAVISADSDEDILKFFKFVVNTVTNSVKNPASKTVITSLDKDAPPPPTGTVNIQDTDDGESDYDYWR